MKLLLKAKLCITIFCLMTFAPYSMAFSTEGKPVRVDCDIHAGPCSAHLSGTKVSLEIDPKPVRALKDLTLTVTFVGEEPVTNPFIDLGMPGMNMGRNRVILKPVGESVYRGEGVIVRCPSGRRTWKATVTVPDVGVVEFVFDVIY
jgi:hypothetical protein